MLLRLTEIGDGIEETRRRVDVDDLRTERGSQPDLDAVLSDLTDARLVTLDAGTVEVAHEALIREWPTLRTWLEEDREGLRLHHRWAKRHGFGTRPGGNTPISTEARDSTPRRNGPTRIRLT